MTPTIATIGPIFVKIEKKSLFPLNLKERYPNNNKNPEHIKEYPTMYPTIEDNPVVIMIIIIPVIIKE